MSVIDSHMYLGAGGPWYPGQLSRTSDPVSRYDQGTPLDAADLKGARFEPAQVLDACSQAGIDRACVQPRRNNEYSAANRFIADACEKHANKLIGIAAHSPQREHGRIRQMLTTEVRSMGLKAVRSDGHPSRELLDAARELGIPIIYYPMNGPIALVRGDYTQEWFYLMADVYSDVNFILPHLGKWGAWSNFAVYRSVIDFARNQKNIFLDTSGLMYVKMLELAVHEIPTDRILFGSCAPELDARVAVETIRLLHPRNSRDIFVAPGTPAKGLTPEQKEKIMGGNIRKLLKL